MRFLLDACAASRSLRALLDDLGHDVVSALAVDPRAADEALLARARDEQRILVTADKDFGELVLVRRLSHPCIIRFVDMRVTEQVTAMLGEDDVNGKGPGDGGPRGDGGALDPRVLDAIVRRVVEVARPERIILFGSAARGDMTRHSDVDLLVIANVEDRLGAMGRIHRRLRGEHAAVDVVVVTPAEVARYRNSHASIIKPAMQEGRIVYEAP